jgi:hypothetical protein
LKSIPPKPVKPEPIIIREKPPQKPKQIPHEFYKIPGKFLPPPPRKVILEKYPHLPEVNIFTFLN